MSQYYNPQRTRNLYNPNTKETDCKSVPAEDNILI